MADEVVIAARDLTKVYRLYEKPKQKFLDMLGLLGTKVVLSEHHALDGVTFDIRRGERVGIIGRNGAGKSTLLKLISGVIMPSSGSLQVQGSARALLEIGTGFHPEFTGRENAKAFLAQLGISGPEAEGRLAKIVDFAEIEEYIDQPLKTYSTGMSARLMFATSTVVAPELLILDEILGVGDAYFTRKSFDRIEEMCRAEGSTLLLVSHDIYTSARLCERMIWLERGRVVFDGEPAEAIKAYEESVREQEEHRLRARAILALKDQTRSDTRAPRRQELLLEFATADARPAAAPVHFSRIALVRGDEVKAEVPLTGEVVGPSGSLIFDGTNWSEIEEWQGEPGRSLRHYGSPFHKVAALLWGQDLLGGPVDEGSEPDGAVVVEFGSEAPVDLIVRGYVAGREVLAAPMQSDASAPVMIRLPLLRSDVGLRWSGGDGRVGTGVVEVLAARLLDDAGHETFVYRHGARFQLEIDYEVRDPAFDGTCDINVGFQRGGVENSCRVFTRDVSLPSPSGTVALTLDRLGLGGGDYSVNLMISRYGYFDRTGQPFFSVNPDVYASVRGLVEFSVKADGVIPNGTSWVEIGSWSSGQQLE